MGCKGGGEWVGFTRQWSRGITRISCALLDGCSLVTVRYALVTIACAMARSMDAKCTESGGSSFGTLFYCTRERKRGGGLVFLKWSEPKWCGRSEMGWSGPVEGTQRLRNGENAPPSGTVMYWFDTKMVGRADYNSVSLRLNLGNGGKGRVRDLLWISAWALVQATTWIVRGWYETQKYMHGKKSPRKPVS